MNWDKTQIKILQLGSKFRKPRKTVVNKQMKITSSLNISDSADFKFAKNTETYKYG